MVGLACPGLAGALLWPRSGNGVLEIGVGKKLNRSLSLDYPRNFLPKDPNEAKDARREIAYFDNNKERMRYAHCKAQGLFAGPAWFVMVNFFSMHLSLPRIGNKGDNDRRDLRGKTHVRGLARLIKS